MRLLGPEPECPTEIQRLSDEFLSLLHAGARQRLAKRAQRFCFMGAVAQLARQLEIFVRRFVLTSTADMRRKSGP